MDGLIDEYRSYSDQIATAIERGDDVTVHQLDIHLAGAFERILSARPSALSEKQEQAKCLLDTLVPEAERTAGQHEMCNKILQIVAA